MASISCSVISTIVFYLLVRSLFWGKDICDVLFSPQPMEVYVDDETKLTLHGLQQYYVKLKDNEKNRKLFDLLDVLEFNQVGGHLPECSGAQTLCSNSSFLLCGIGHHICQVSPEVCRFVTTVDGTELPSNLHPPRNGTGREV